MAYKDKKKQKEKQKEYYQKNKEKILEERKKHYQENKEQINEQHKEYDQTPAGKKLNTIRKWKKYGLIHDDYSTLYNDYLECTHCQVCKTEFKDTFDRCMDHDHDTGLFRQFLCRSCNVFDSWKDKV